MTTGHRSYAFSGFGVRDTLLMKSMVERAALRTGHAWLLGAIEAVDCVFYQGEMPTEVRHDAVCIAIGKHEDGAVRALQYPPRIIEFVAALAAIDPKPDDGKTARSSVSRSWHQLVESLQQRLAVGRTIAMIDASGSGWTLEPEERQYMARGASERAPRELLETSAEQWRLIETVPPLDQPRRAMESLMWFLGMAAGAEGVLPSIGSERPLRLRVWPYLLARAPRRFTEIANQLRQGPRSASDLQAALQATAGEIAAFVNACVLCGFLVPLAEAEPFKTHARVAPYEAVAPRPGERFTRFLGAIRVALGMPA